MHGFFIILEVVFIRLDKYLAEMSVGTRNEVKKIIKSGQVTVNGIVVLKPEMKVNEETDKVCVCGTDIYYKKYVYFMLNKPAGYVSATKDNKYKTVIELIKENNKSGIFPVGRLDIDTEGMLIITNDGALSHKLMSPRKHVDKKYFLVAEGFVTDNDIKQIEEGIDIGDDKITLPAKVSDIKHYTNNKGIWTSMCLTIHEGRYHQVKRMLGAVGNPVTYLKRISIGNLKLDENLSPGEYRQLSEEELELLFTTDNNIV